MPALRILEGAGNARATLSFATHEAVDGIEADVWVQRGELFVRPSRPPAVLPLPLRRARTRRIDEDRVEIVEVLAMADSGVRLLFDLRTTGDDAASHLARVLYPLPDRSHLILACDASTVADRLRAWLPDTRVCTMLTTERALRRYVQARMSGTLPQLPVLVPAALLHTAAEMESLRRRAGFVGVRNIETVKRARDFDAWGADFIVSPSLEVLVSVR